MSEAHLSRYVIAKVKFERLHYAYGYGYGRHIGNATASLKSAYVYYVYDHQRHLLTTTSLQIGIFPQLLQASRLTLKRRRPLGSELDIFRSPKDCVGALKFVSAA